MIKNDDEIIDTAETMGFVSDEEYEKNPMAFDNALRDAEDTGWQRWPDDKVPNTPVNLKKYNFIEIGTILYFKEK